MDELSSYIKYKREVLAINALNLVDPDVGIIEATLRKKANRQIIFKYGGMSNGVGQMVFDVKNAATTASVEVLRIWSHGSAGAQGVSAQPQVTPTGERAGIALSNFDQIQKDLSQLRPYFVSGGRLELRGCNVGVGDDGIKLLKTLANTLQIEVHAPLDNQPIGPVDWKGPVQKVTPQGAVFTISGLPI
jgi:hypothetical protein